MRTQYGAGVTVSADALKAWNAVPESALRAAQLTLPPERRPSIAAMAQVGWLLAWGFKDAQGYSDLTQQQLLSACKGGHGDEAVKHACQALDKGGVWIAVKRGHKGKDGKAGSGSWRVLSTHDPQGLIATANTGWLPPHDCDETQGGEPSNTGWLTDEHRVVDHPALSNQLKQQAPAPAGALVAYDSDEACALEHRPFWNQPRVASDSPEAKRLHVALLARVPAKRNSPTWAQLQTYAVDTVTYFPAIDPTACVDLAHRAFSNLPRGSRAERRDAFTEAAQTLGLEVPDWEAPTHNTESSSK